MIAKQTSLRDGVEDALCPFTDIYITQGSNEGNHLGTKAIDVRGINQGVKYPYYAPCTCKCIKVYPNNGQSHWTSVEKVNLANGQVDYITFLIAHDNTFDAYVGQTIKQGNQIGNLGNLGNATGVHCHIEVGIGSNLELIQLNNVYETWTFPIDKEIEFEEAFFLDNTNILHGYGNWIYLNKTNTSDQIEDMSDTDETKEEDKKTEIDIDSGIETEKQLDKNKEKCVDKIIFEKKIEKTGFYGIQLYVGENLIIKVPK